MLPCLRSDGPGSRADLAKQTGMAKATIGTIIGELVEIGAVVESESSLAEGRGRPGRPIRFVEGAYVGLGFELNVDYVTAVRGGAKFPAESIVQLSRLWAASTSHCADLLSRVSIAAPGVRCPRISAWQTP